MATRTAFLVRSPRILLILDLSPRAHRGATRRRRRPLRKRPLWWRALFQQSLRREPHGRALRLAALLVRKALSPACGTRIVLHFVSFASSAVTSVEPPAGPHAIYSADSANASLVSAAIPTPTAKFLSFLLPCVLIAVSFSTAFRGFLPLDASSTA
jgi:hypothetical protein